MCSTLIACTPSHLQVKATDGGADPQSNSLDVKFQLLNDTTTRSMMAPTFDPIGTVYLLETVAVFEMVEMVTARDSDSEDLWYRIVGELL